MTSSETTFNDEELIARLRENQRYEWQDPIWETRLAAADRIKALIAENAKLHDHIEGVAKDTHKIMVGYEAKLAKAMEGQKVKALEQILEERGAVFDAMVDAAEDAAGKDVSFNVVVGRALRAALAEIKGESHE